MSSRESRREGRLSGRKRAEEHKSGFDRTAIQVPDGVSLFSLDREGTRRIDIIPFIAGAGNPYADEGLMHFERTYFLHRDVGSALQAYVCPRKSFGKRCPICEARAEMTKDPDADEEVIKALAPKERQLWNVFDHDEPSKGVQLWDITYHWFGKLLDARIKNQESDDEYEYFADPKTGFTLRLTVSESGFARNKFEVSAIDFKPRKQPLDPDILEAAMNLDELVIEQSYATLKSIFLQVDDIAETEEDDDEETAPPKKATKKPAPKAEQEEDDDEEPTPPKKSAPKKPAPNVEEDDDWDDDDEPTPSKKSTPKKPVTKKPVPKVEEEDDDWDDDDEPVLPKKATKKQVPKVEEEWEDVEDEEPAPKSKAKKKPAPKVEEDDDWEDTEVPF